MFVVWSKPLNNFVVTTMVDNVTQIILRRYRSNEAHLAMTFLTLINNIPDAFLLARDVVDATDRENEAAREAAVAREMLNDQITAADYRIGLPVVLVERFD